MPLTHKATMYQQSLITGTGALGGNILSPMRRTAVGVPPVTVIDTVMLTPHRGGPRPLGIMALTIRVIAVATQDYTTVIDDNGLLSTACTKTTAAIVLS